jgi:quinolinate synthase
MFKSNPQNLLRTLENIEQFNVIAVPGAIKADARLALDRMLALAS